MNRYDYLILVYEGGIFLSAFIYWKDPFEWYPATPPTLPPATSHSEGIPTLPGEPKHHKIELSVSVGVTASLEMKVQRAPTTKRMIGVVAFLLTVIIPGWIMHFYCNLFHGSPEAVLLPINGLISSQIFLKDNPGFENAVVGLRVKLRRLSRLGRKA